MFVTVLLAYYKLVGNATKWSNDLSFNKLFLAF